MNLQESIRRILREYHSPSGKKIIPNEIVVHKSAPYWRENILETGLQVSVGECYQVYVGDEIKCKPAIFATNSTNKEDWFSSTYDDDVWFIDTTKIPDVKWYKDRHFKFNPESKHIVTFQDIPSEALTLHYEGSGKSEDLLEESSKKILKEGLPNETYVFPRRIKLEDVKRILPLNAEQVYYEVGNYRLFKYELTLRSVESIMYNKYNLGWEDLPEKEEIEFVTEVSEKLDDHIKYFYNMVKSEL